MAHIRTGTVTVIRGGFHNYGNAARAVALIHNDFVVDVSVRAGSLFYGTFNVVVRHVVCLGLSDKVAELAVGYRVRTAVAHRHGNFFTDLGKDLGTL